MKIVSLCAEWDIVEIISKYIKLAKLAAHVFKNSKGCTGISQKLKKYVHSFVFSR